MWELIRSDITKINMETGNKKNLYRKAWLTNEKNKFTTGPDFWEKKEENVHYQC